ncbi:MAG: arginine--tRNA ligase, partial [Candidatus Saccharibacteria bacterium]|nr:arginine--tRNA ligase [Candidatus Saccharibacteria bacterium]
MQKIREELKKVIKDLYGLDDFDPELTPSPDNIDADYSSNAPLKLAKELHKSPMEIAEELQARMAQLGTFESICDNGSKLASEPRNDRRRSRVDETLAFRVEATPDGRPDRVDGPAGRDPAADINISNPGFLNFTLSDNYLTDKINDLNKNFRDSISSAEYQGQTVICEFSDPNPFKVLHVGHLYTSIVGDAISRLYEYAGAKVIRANFGGDVGLHVAKTMYALRQKDPADLTIEDIAKCYVEGTAAYADDEQAKQEITKLNKEIYQINAHNLHDTEVAKLYWKGRELSYQYFDQFYESIGVKFDKYYPESTVAALGLAKVKEQLEKGIYEVSAGAVIFDGEKYGLHTRVFINQEGVPTYETKDVGLIFTKWQDYHFDKSIVITGSEQLEYMKVVLKSVEQYAPELVERTTHLTHGLVKLPGGVKMSSRKGNFLKAVDVLNMVRDALQSEFNSGDETVSLAATKYAFLKYKMGGNIIFDPQESVKMTGNSGPYLLYSAVRAKKILEKFDELQDAQRVS